MEIVTLLFFMLVCVLLFGAPKRTQRFFGITAVVLAVIFLIGQWTVKYQTSFYRLSRSEWINQDGGIVLGNWVIPFYVLAALFFLILMNVRFRQAAQRGRKWLWVSAAIVTSLLYVAVACFAFFIVVFLFYPFAP